MNTLDETSLSPQDVERGLRMSTWDGVFAHMSTMLTTGAILSGFAVSLGLPNTLIGLLAAIIPISQIAQIPAVGLIERSRRRKRWAILGATVGRLAWLPAAAIPVIAEGSGWAGLAFVGFAVLSFFFQSLGASAYTSWLRDLVPPSGLGRFFGRRLGLSVAAGAVVLLLAGFAVDALRGPLGPVKAHVPVFLVGAGVGLCSLVFLLRTPEPPMPPREEGEGSMLRRLGRPFADPSFRPLLRFTAAWNLAVHFGGPFFAVYMLERIGLSLGTVAALSVWGQLVNVLFLSLWGPIVDRLGHVGVLRNGVLVFSASFLIWPLTTFPEPHAWTLPLLVLAETMMGIGTAGITLCGGNLALKSSPARRAPAYLATVALVTGVFATAAPLAAGVLADATQTFELRVVLEWSRRFVESGHVAALVLEGLDFVFLVAFVLGLYAAHRTLGIPEESERRTGPLLAALLGQMRQVSVSVGSLPSIRALAAFPYGALRRRRSG